MSDHQLREAERVWKLSGDFDDWSRWALMMRRQGDPDPWRLFQAMIKTLRITKANNHLIRIPYTGSNARRWFDLREKITRLDDTCSKTIVRLIRSVPTPTAWIKSYFARDIAKQDLLQKTKREARLREKQFPGSPSTSYIPFNLGTNIGSASSGYIPFMGTVSSAVTSGTVFAGPRPGYTYPLNFSR